SASAALHRAGEADLLGSVRKLICEWSELGIKESDRRLARGEPFESVLTVVDHGGITGVGERRRRRRTQQKTVALEIATKLAIAVGGGVNALAAVDRHHVEVFHRVEPDEPFGLLADLANVNPLRNASGDRGEVGGQIFAHGGSVDGRIAI